MSRTQQLIFRAGMALWAILAPVSGLPQVRTAVLQGQVRDRDTGEGLGWTSILLVELGRSATAHEDGRFEISNVPPGTYTLRAFRIGYENTSVRVEVRPPRTVVEIRMPSTAVMMQTVEVTSDLEARKGLAGTLGSVVHRVRLRHMLARTLAETLAQEPGLASSSMGPATARPVLRGMSGHRVAILEDGAGTGDLSATSPDHAVAIDPLQAERIEILRGPEVLLYSPNVLTGVLNVVRGTIPEQQTDHLHGAASLQAESVSAGLAGGMGLLLPILSGTARVDASLRRMGDVRTPSGPLRNSGLTSASAAMGWGLNRTWGAIGISALGYAARYGVPGGFVGAHPEGVTVEMARAQLSAQAELALHGGSWSGLLFKQDATLFALRELESGGIVGTDYALFAYQARALARQSRWGPFRNGAVALEIRYRDFAAGGGVSTPAAWMLNLALAAYQEWSSGPWLLRAALRTEGSQVSPYEERTSRTIGAIRSRRFGNVATAVTLARTLPYHMDVRVGLTRAFRAPELEELYSEGPHLASYSFEVGNPALGQEVGYGLEFSLRWSPPGGRLELTGYRNRIYGYIFPRPTGQINPRTLLPVYQYTGTDALFWGAEGTLEWRLMSSWALATSASYVRAGFVPGDAPLPMIPPPQGRLELRYGSGPLSAMLVLRWAAGQNRVHAFEEPTPGYAVFDASVQYYWTRGACLHTLVLGAENLTNRLYRQHLSRIKAIMPEPGRNVKLLYRVYF